MKQRQLLSSKVLDEFKSYYDQRIPISIAFKLLKLENDIHYKTAFNIVKADIKGFTNATRPEWLESSPKVQTAPSGWRLRNGLTEQGEWVYEVNT